MTTNFSQLKIGGTGYVTSIDIATDGTMFAGTDTAGAFKWSTAQDRWVQLVDSTTAAFVTLNGTATAMAYSGSWQIRAAPGNSSVVYLVYQGRMFKSTDSGSTWTSQVGTGAWPSSFTETDAPSNDTSNASRLINPKMAVDPSDATHVIVHTMTHGAYRTTDGGTTWAQIADGPITTTIPGTVVFGTGAIFLTYWGGGVYKSTDGGATFSQIGSTGPGTTCDIYNAAVGADGTYYAISGNPNAGNTTIWRYAGTTWTDITPSASAWWSLAPNPNSSGHLLVFSGGGCNGATSANSGTPTWGGQTGAVLDASGDTVWATNILAPTVGTGTAYSGGFNQGQVRPDPVTANRYWMTEGVGVWYVDIPLNGPSTTFTWHSQARGVEQFVTNQIIKPPGSTKVYIAGWDRGVFVQDTTTLDSYSAVQTPNANFQFSGSVGAAVSDPTFIVALVYDYYQYQVEKLYKSTDSGATWTACSSTFNYAGTGALVSGHIAVADSSRFVWVPNGQLHIPHYTTDGGATFTQCSMPVEYTGFNNTGQGGWGALGSVLKRHICDFDKVTAGKVYLYWSDPDHTTGGLLSSTDHGATFTTVNSNYRFATSGGGNALSSGATAYHAKLRAVPNNAGHLFFTSGADGQASEFIRSTDSGATWSVVSGVANVYAFGFGAAQSGQTYPAVYVIGTDGTGVTSTWGIYASYDDCASWTQLSGYPLNMLSFPSSVEGDMDLFGRVFVGFGGAGAIYGAASILHHGGKGLRNF